DYSQPAQVNGAPNPGYLPVTSQVKLAKILDGTSNSSLFSETTRSVAVANTAAEVPPTSLLNVYYIPAANFDSTAPVDACQTSTLRLKYRGQEYYRNLPPTAFYSHTMTPNTKNYDCSNNSFNCTHTAARSYHPGGVNVGFCDGSVHFIKNTI